MTSGSSSLLIVDDNEDNRYTLMRRLKREGYTELHAAENGAEALDLLSDTPVDLVLLDIMMPVMNGYETLERIKGNPELRDIPVIMITAVDEMDSVVRCIESGAEDHLQKPFNAALLRARVSTCLEKKRLRDQEIEYLHQVSVLTDAAAIIEDDDFSPDALEIESVATRTDALGQLARVLSHMAQQVYSREQKLKNKVLSLQIEIDKARQEEQVSSITGTDYFQDLKKRAGDLRTMLQDKNSGTD